MKAREIKKKLLQDYRNKTKAYKERMSQNIQDMAVRQAKIRQLEEVLDNCFGVEELFDFNFIYPATEIERVHKQIVSEMKEIV